MTKFEIDADNVFVETPFNALFTIRNTGTADAGPFTVAVQETNTDDGVEGPFHPAKVDGGLAAGDSFKASISVQLAKAGYWKLTAIADIEKNVDESKEDDNSKELNFKVLSGLPDLGWANGAGFSFTASQTKAGYYDVAYDFINTGTADYAGETTFIAVTWYRDEDSASGEFSEVPVGDLAIGEERVLEQSLQMPGPGTYTIYALLDDRHVVDELNEDNNETQIKVSVP